MKKVLYTMACLMVALCFVACGNEPNNPNEGENGNGNGEGEGNSKNYAELIIGTFRLEKATQDNGSANPVDMTAMYGGSAFVLTFKENGELITANGIDEATMAYELDGEYVDFIQTPGASPVRYHIEQCDDQKLIIVHGYDTDTSTTLILNRE